MTLPEAQKEIAIKYKLGTSLVTGHKASYFNEAAELYAQQFKEKATKWEALGAKVHKCYFNDDDTELDDENIDLGTIGEITATAFGYL